MQITKISLSRLN